MKNLKSILIGVLGLISFGSSALAYASDLITCSISTLRGRDEEVLFEASEEVAEYNSFIVELLNKDTGWKKDYLFKARLSETGLTKLSYAATDASYLFVADALPLPKGNVIDMTFYTPDGATRLMCKR